jgi:hypothetical protein
MSMPLMMRTLLRIELGQRVLKRAGLCGRANGHYGERQHNGLEHP